MTLFEMVEFETRTLFDEEAVTKVVEEHAMKLIVRDSSTDAPVGTLWLAGRYKENIGASGILAANPNPPNRPPRRSLIFRHLLTRNC